MYNHSHARLVGFAHEIVNGIHQVTGSRMWAIECDRQTDTHMQSYIHTYIHTLPDRNVFVVILSINPLPGATGRFRVRQAGGLSLPASGRHLGLRGKRLHSRKTGAERLAVSFFFFGRDGFVAFTFAWNGAQ